MKIHLSKASLLLLLPVFIITAEWHHNLSDALTTARSEHKNVLLNFSGSDWCGPCIRLKKEFFETDVFNTMADSELVLVNADFPRSKKNQLTADQQKLNDAMADRYNQRGIFPYTILLNPNGRVLKSWEGLPDESAEKFIQEIRYFIYSENK